MKFGGTSVGSADAIRSAARIVVDAKSRKPIVVVSAIAGVTNSLLAMARAKMLERLKMIEEIRRKHDEIASSLGLDPKLLDPEFKELRALAMKRGKVDRKRLDAYVSFGERLSAKLMAGQLANFGMRAQAYAAWEIGMITNDDFGSAEPLPEAMQKLKKLEKLEATPVITGFIGKTKKGDITTLGRGGSDYTAAIIGAAVKAEAIQIWKEVDGFMTTDPRLVPEAKIVPELAFEEASELAYFGAKVLHPKTILPAMKACVPVQILNTFKPDGAGTTIVTNFAERKQKSHEIEAIAFKKNISIIHIESIKFFDGTDLLSDIFKTYHKHHANIDVIALSIAGVSLAMDTAEITPAILKELAVHGPITVVGSKAIVCAVGGSIDAAGAAGKMFSILGANGIAVEMISQAASGFSITFALAESDAEKAIKTLHKQYIENTGASF